MARRIAKFLKTAKVTVFPELPGAIFYGDILADDIDTARRRQAIRDDFEATDCLTTLRRALQHEGFGRDEISDAIWNPRTITDCAYCGFSPPTAALLSLTVSL